MEDPDSASFIVNGCFIILQSFTGTFSLQVLLGLMIMVLLLAGSAMISGSEIAYFSLSPNHLKIIRESKAKHDALIFQHLSRPRRLLATILITNNFINVAIVILSVFITKELFDLERNPVLTFIIQVIIVTALILMFGEILPKMYATRNPLKFAKFMAYPIKLLIQVFYPLSSLLVRSTNFIDKRLASRNLNISMSDLEEAIEITANESTPEEEKKILKGIVKFGDIDVKEIMKSRVDVIAIDIQSNFEELLKVIRNSGYSRIPVYENSFDNVKGILYVKDLLSHIEKEDNFKWQSLIRDAFFVPENKKISDLLKEFQEKKIHLAIIVDEYGGTSGIVTLEDIIEEIVGEIVDEFDVGEDEVEFTRLDKQNYIFEGKTTINDFCKIIGIEDSIFDNVKGDSDSLAGLILEMEGKIPEKDAIIKYHDFEFRILAADDRRIQKIRVAIKPQKIEDEI